MEIVKKSETKEFKNSDTCIAIEYSMKDRDINGAVIVLNGRYPNEGTVVNQKCKEMAYIIKGSVKLTVEGKETSLSEGDLALVDVGEKYFWEGNVTMFIPCTPAWYPEQHTEVKNE
jgi:mannose-6-phosphate isomerase-like protein (cupin superfamily)